MTGLLSQHFEKVPSFVAVARLGSFNKAAESLSISQAALSQSMKRLEEVLDVSLFVRSRNGVSLTSQGKILFQTAQAMLDDIEVLESRIKKNQEQEISKIRIGTHETLAIHYWPEIISKYQEKYPQHLLSLFSGRIDYLVQQVLSGDLDLILTVKPRPSKNLESICLYSDELAFYGPSRNAICPPKISFDQLSKLTILTDSQAHLSQENSVKQMMERNNIFSSTSFQLNSFEAAAKLASKGIGIALLPSKITQELRERYNLVKIAIQGATNLEFKHQVYYSYSRNKVHTSKIENLIKYLKSLDQRKN